MTQRKNPGAGPDKPDEDADENVDPIIGDAVGGQLKSFYSDLAKAPVPDRFSALIEQLEKSEAARDGEDKS